MNTFISLCFFAVFLLLLLVKPGEGIRCWVCSSDTDSRCGDPFNQSHFALTDCDRDKTQSPFLQSISVCRKAKQKTHYGEVITRSCNWMTEASRDGSCHDSSSHYNSKFEYCSTCSHDACNSAHALKISSAAILPLAAAMFWSVRKYV